MVVVDFMINLIFIQLSSRYENLFFIVPVFMWSFNLVLIVCDTTRRSCDDDDDDDVVDEDEDDMATEVQTINSFRHKILSSSRYSQFIIHPASSGNTNNIKTIPILVHTITCWCWCS